MSEPTHSRHQGFDPGKCLLDKLRPLSLTLPLVLQGPYGLSCPVKVLEITEHEGSKIGELEQLKVFLEKLPYLELVKVVAYATDDKEKSRITKDLLMVPRSPECNIQIMFCEDAVPRLSRDRKL